MWSPSSASLTRTWQSVSSRCANERVKVSGMCCTMTMPGVSAGSGTRNSRSASVPPVEAPTAMTLCVLLRSARGALTGGRGAAPAAGAASGRTRAAAATFTLWMISAASSTVPAATSTLGLLTKSMAPSSSARRVVSQPRSVSDETISTGIGWKRISFSRNESPSMRGISTSRVRTSGCRARIWSRAM